MCFACYTTPWKEERGVWVSREVSELYLCLSRKIHRPLYPEDGSQVQDFGLVLVLFISLWITSGWCFALHSGSSRSHADIYPFIGAVCVVWRGLAPGLCSPPWGQCAVWREQCLTISIELLNWIWIHCHLQCRVPQSLQ